MWFLTCVIVHLWLALQHTTVSDDEVLDLEDPSSNSRVAKRSRGGLGLDSLSASILLSPKMGISANSLTLIVKLLFK